MTTEEQLIERYGILLSLHGNTEFAKMWRPVKKKIGRHVCFRASDVARLIDDHVQF